MKIKMAPEKLPYCNILESSGDMRVPMEVCMRKSVVAGLLQCFFGLHKRSYNASL